jgi:hypothetical protein
MEGMGYRNLKVNEHGGRWHQSCPEESLKLLAYIPFVYIPMQEILSLVYNHIQKPGKPSQLAIKNNK